MRSFIAFVVLACFAAALSACSTHPLPEDFARKSTYEIVQKIRCEAREGIVQAHLTEDALANTYVGFDFTFDMIENNKAAGGLLEFLHPFSSGKFSLAVSGGVDKMRQNERFFRVVQLFKDLRDDRSCEDVPERANLLYPIAGHIGLDEVVRTYARLRTAGSFRKDKNASVFSDTLTFTTRLNAGIKPSLELNSTAGRLRLTKASIDGTAERKDVHKVAIAISTKKDVKDVVETFTISPYFSRRAGPSPGIVSGAAGVILELDRLRNRDEDVRALETLRLLQ